MPGAVRPCRADELAIGALRWAGATSTLQGRFVIADTGEEACAVQGEPDVELFDGDKRLAIEGRHHPGAEIARAVLLPGLGLPAPDDGPILGRAAEELF